MIKIVTIVKEIKKDMEEQHVGAYAAQSAYFMILSFLPLIILLLSLIQYTEIGKGELYRLIQVVIPMDFLIPATFPWMDGEGDDRSTIILDFPLLLIFLPNSHV